MSNTNIYKQAAKAKLRVATSRGPLSVEQLMDLTKTELDGLAVGLEKEHSDSGTKSFLSKKSDKSTIAKLKFDIVLDILNTKVKSDETASKSRDTKAHNEKIQALILKKKEGDLEGKSLEELESMLID
jgi:hypothetical protein